MADPEPHVAILTPEWHAVCILSDPAQTVRAGSIAPVRGKQTRAGKNCGIQRLSVMPKTKIKSKAKPELESQFLLEAPEVSIFLACVAAVNQLRALAAQYETGELSRVAFSRRSTVIVADLSELACASERFDIVCPVLEFGRFSPFFWRWYNWWYDFVKDFTPRQVNHLVQLAGRGSRATSGSHPKSDWLRYRQTPAFALIIT